MIPLAAADSAAGFVQQLGSPLWQSSGATGVISAGGKNGTLVDGSVIRVGIVPDPLDSTKTCWALRLNQTDADVRSELTFGNTPFLMGKKYLCAVATNFGDWRTQKDEVVAGFQIHSPDADVAEPWMALYISPAGLRVNVRSCPSLVQSASVDHVIYQDDGWLPYVWDRWV